MRWFDAIRSGRTEAGLTDRDIELLLTGAPSDSDEFADLEVFIESMSGSAELSRDPGQMVTALAATARAARPSLRRGLRRVVALAASVAVLFALSGVAIAADDAVPGDFLYEFDRTLELIGIGDGGVDERIVEFDALIARGEDERAFELLDEFAESAPEAEAAEAQRHIELAATKSNAIAAAAQERVAAKKELIEENRGNGVGLDGSEFGQGVADQTPSNSNGDASDSATPPGKSNSETQGPPEHASSESSDDAPGQSADEEKDTQGRSNSNPGGNNSSDNGGGNDGNAGNGGGGGTTGNEEPSENSGKKGN